MTARRQLRDVRQAIAVDVKTVRGLTAPVSRPSTCWERSTTVRGAGTHQFVVSPVGASAEVVLCVQQALMGDACLDPGNNACITRGDDGRAC